MPDEGGRSDERLLRRVASFNDGSGFRRRRHFRATFVMAYFRQFPCLYFINGAAHVKDGRSMRSPRRRGRGYTTPIFQKDRLKILPLFHGRMTRFRRR